MQYGEARIAFVFDEWKFLKDFSLICKGDKRQFIYPNQANLNASTLSVSRQIYFDFIVFWFFSEANLSIAATPHRLKVNSSNTFGGYKPITKDFDFNKFFCHFFSFYETPRSKKLCIIPYVMLKTCIVSYYCSTLLLPDFAMMLDA